MTAKAFLLLQVAVGAVVVLCAASGAVAQLAPGCTVSVLNRTVQVNAEGAWVLPNVPANFGLVRARATCVRNGVTMSGESEPFTVPANGVVNLPTIQFGQMTPIPTALVLTAPTTKLTVGGQTTQLTVTAVYSDNSTKDVTAGSNVTQYTVSNPAIATVTGDGLVQAVASGTVLIQATHEGASGMATISVVLAGLDSDGDGLPDDWEIAHGLDPNNPADAFEDADRDGLTNLEEFLNGTDLRNPDSDGDGLTDGDEVKIHHTSPLNRDTDGDGISDGLEVATGSNPLDPKSFNLAAALTSIDVTPGGFTLVFNTVAGDASRQLTVTGHLKDGTTIDLTSTAKQTNYTSSDLAICNFGVPDGRVFAGKDGVCTVTVSNNGFSKAVQVTVKTFSPKALSFVSIPSPGFANSVAVNGNFAYVAAGSTGLQVVDVTDRTAPRIVASRDTPGNANDVKVVGKTAFVADGPSGLQVIDIGDPLQPAIVGAADTPGNAQGLVVRGNVAFVADGSKGLQAIDVTSLAAPQIIGAVAIPGTAYAVDANLSLARAVVAAGGQGLVVVGIGNLATPTVMGSVITGDARGVVLTPDGNFALVADVTNSFTTVDLSDPAHPKILGATPRNLGGLLVNVALSGPFAFGADIFFVNGVPIIDVSTPAVPIPRAILDFGGFRDDNATGIAVDGTYVYLTAAVGSDSRLYIGQYLALEDTGNVPPTVSIDSPDPGDTVTEGEKVTVEVTAADDVAVAKVDLLLNNQVVSTVTSAPYQFAFTVPIGVTTLTLGAAATDLAGNVGAATPVVLNVIPDPLTTVIGLVKQADQSPVDGAIVTVPGGLTGVTAVDGSFSIANVPTILGNIVAKASATIDAQQLQGVSKAAPPVSGGVTDVGSIALVGGLIAYWSFDDQQNPTADSIGGHNGTVNGASFTTTDIAPVPQNVAAVATTIGRIVAADPTAFDFSSTTPFTIALWLKQTEIRGVYHVFGKRPGCGGGANWYQMARDGGGFGFGSAVSGVRFGVDLPFNAWTHIAVTYDGAGVLRAYLNGNEFVTKSGFGMPALNTVPLVIGDSGLCNQTFPGLIDEVRVYSRAIAPAEVAGLAYSTNLITNGSFEMAATVDPSGNYVTISGTEIVGWTVSGQNVDYVGGRFAASHGDRSVDLNGSSGPGAVSQSFPTDIGTTYRVRFDMAANPEGPPTTKTVRVTAGDSSNVFSFDATGRTPQDMGWQEKSMTFTATAATTTLSFASETSDCCYGPELDNVRVDLAP